MSELLAQIKKDQVQARKDGDKSTATALTTLIGEASPSGNETTTDQKVQAVIKKFVKNLEEMSEYTEDFIQNSIFSEITLYKSYLPKQIEGSELEEVIDDLFLHGDCSSIGSVMKRLNADYRGQFDGKEASLIIKSKL